MSSKETGTLDHRAPHKRERVVSDPRRQLDERMRALLRHLDTIPYSRGTDGAPEPISGTRRKR